MCDVNDRPDILNQLMDVDYIIAGAAMIGGITYFHKYAYDLLAQNERIMAATFDLAIRLHREASLQRILVISSSMVFENTEVYPTPESEVVSCPPPMSTYGFQKLAVEYFCKGAWEQYQVPYTIVRPFNCVGIGEEEAINEHEVTSGNVKLMMSHVLPDIINKILQGQDPLHLLGTGEQVRCYTNGRDIARGIRLALQTPEAENEDFNISTPVSTSVKELAQVVWGILKPDHEFTYVSDPAYLYDVQKRVPDVSKARDILGFEAEIPLEDSVREVIQWFRRKENE
jgi:nucleoside-diphosphate-sugar epimerase